MSGLKTFWGGGLLNYSMYLVFMRLPVLEFPLCGSKASHPSVFSSGSSALGGESDSPTQACEFVRFARRRSSLWGKASELSYNRNSTTPQSWQCMYRHPSPPLNWSSSAMRKSTTMLGGGSLVPNERSMQLLELPPHFECPLIADEFFFLSFSSWMDRIYLDFLLTFAFCFYCSSKNNVLFSFQ